MLTFSFQNYEIFRGLIVWESLSTLLFWPKNGVLFIMSRILVVHWML